MKDELSNEGLTILLIDPDGDTCEVLRVALHHRGFRTVIATHPTEGLRLARAVKPDLIITELFESDSGKWTFLTALTHDATARELPVVAFSAYAFEADGEAALRSGAIMFLPKPLPPQEVVEAVETVLRQ